MTEEYEFQAVYKGYTNADSIDHAHQLVAAMLDLTQLCLCDLVIHRLDELEVAQKRSKSLMCEAVDQVETEE